LTAHTLKGGNPKNELTEVNDFDSKYFDLDSLATKASLSFWICAPILSEILGF
tara:strand:- start:724 stop:882 length:159 start_codon:yes stop_codon:yes gene_type:complete